MSGSTEHLDLISESQAQKATTANALHSAAAPAEVYARRVSTCVGLVWGYYGGTVLVGTTPTVIANGTLTLTASMTAYIRKLDSTGVVSFVTSPPASWPGPSGGYTALYQAVVGASSVTSWIDYRTTLVTSGTASTPGGSNTNIQYNDGGVFGGDSRLLFNETTKVVSGQFTVDSGGINAQTGTTYTLAATDNGAVVTLDNVAAVTVSIPVGLGIGFSCILIQKGAGQVTVATVGSPSVSLFSYTNLRKITGQHGAASLIAYAADTFNLSGNLVV